MRGMAAKSFAIVALVTALGPGSAAGVAFAADFETSFEPSEQEQGWQFLATPYLWLAGVQGDFAVDDLTVKVDESFTEILDNLNMAFMSRFELRHGRGGLLADFVFVDANDLIDILDETITVDNQVAFATFLGAYRPLESGKSYVDVLAGVRAWAFESGILIEGDDDVLWKDNWVDPIVGARGRLQFSDRFFATGYGDVGGFGMGSDLTWQAMGTVGYELYDHFDLSAGYRYLYVRRDTVVDGQNITSEERFSGPIVEGTLKF